jgi:hypothetical protein
MLLAPFVARFVQTFVAEPFRQLADQTGRRRRLGKIDPFAFIPSLVFGQMSASRQTLSSQAQTLSEPVPRQAVDQRFNPQARRVLASFLCSRHGPNLRLVHRPSPSGGVAGSL